MILYDSIIFPFFFWNISLGFFSLKISKVTWSFGDVSWKKIFVDTSFYKSSFGWCCFEYFAFQCTNPRINDSEQTRRFLELVALFIRQLYQCVLFWSKSYIEPKGFLMFRLFYVFDVFVRVGHFKPHLQYLKQYRIICSPLKNSDNKKLRQSAEITLTKI